MIWKSLVAAGGSLWACLIMLAPADAQSVSQYRYDGLGRLIRAEDGNDNFSSYQYDPAGNRSGVTSATQFLQSWNTNSSAIGHVVGRADADGWSARVEDSAGHMIYGPYTTDIPIGARVASYRMLVDNNTASDSDVVNIDVFDATSGTTLALRTVTRREWKAAGAYQVFELPFDINSERAGHAIEFRIYYFRTSYVRVQKVGCR